MMRWERFKLQYFEDGSLLLLCNVWCHGVFSDVMVLQEAVDVAIESNSKKLILFHHSPDYTDQQIDEIEKKAIMDFPDVIAAKQGLEIKI